MLSSRKNQLRRSSSSSTEAAPTEVIMDGRSSATTSSSSTTTTSSHYFDHRELIVGGDIVPPGKYPFFVLLNYGDCGGSLIAPDIVLTAGHCKPTFTIRNARKPKDWDRVDWVRIGPYERFPDRDDDDDGDEEHDPSLPMAASETEYEWLEEETFAVLDATRHTHFKRYGDDEFRYDYTIIKLNGTSIHPTLELYRQPLGDENADDDDDDNNNDDDDDSNNNGAVEMIQVTAMGMGDTNKHRPSRSNVLREVNLTVVPNSICEGTHDGDGMSYEGRIGRSHLCTFAPHKDSCNYDSGSPIILFDGADDLRPKLVGQVSWGEECADPIFPAVNSRISTVLDWIDGTVCEWSDQPPRSFGCFPEDDITVIPVVLPDDSGSSSSNNNNNNNIVDDWMSHLPKPGDADFVWVVIMSILAAGAGRYLWKLRRSDCDYTQLK